MNLLNSTKIAPTLIGMIHLDALPGSPGFDGDFQDILAHALADASALVDAGFDALMVENYNDVPFFANRVPALTIASMSRCICAIRIAFPTTPLGVNVLRNDGVSALSIAQACDAQFIRVNVLSGASVTDQGLIQSQAADLLRARSAWQSRVKIFADVGVKHAVPLGPCELAPSARDTAYRGLADALVVSGIATGAQTSKADIDVVKKAVPDRQVFVGSGVTLDNFVPSMADGFIIGTSIKSDGRVCTKKARQMVDLRNQG
ncbi:MAG: BtpA/SgcQ family protein [Myxococcota bacterium]|nr:BtpA/SgcQ family protein [Myxococcota bacterium]